MKQPIQSGGEALSAIARNPEYRALTIYSRLPEGCVAQLVTDIYSAPHIRAGEFVVVDTNDREVRHLETYLIEWNGGSRNVCEAVAQEFNFSGEPKPHKGWNVRSISGLRGKAAMEHIRDTLVNSAGSPDVGGLAWSEGTFRSDDGYLESKLVGCVIGIYVPAFEEPKRMRGRTV